MVGLLPLNGFPRTRNIAGIILVLIALANVVDTSVRLHRHSVRLPVFQPPARIVYQRMGRDYVFEATG